MKNIHTGGVKTSRLLFADLAGSDRVAKSRLNGTELREAKSMNSAMFYLDMVIVALYEKATYRRKHIPFRNSMLTTVLRYDSNLSQLANKLALLITHTHYNYIVTRNYSYLCNIILSSINVMMKKKGQSILLVYYYL